jgi:hypothetical protein
MAAMIAADAVPEDGAAGFGISRATLTTAAAVLRCRTKIKKAGSDDRNRPLSWVGDTGFEPVTSPV